MLKAIIAGDDTASCLLLKKQLEEYETIKILSVVKNGEHLLKAASDFKPQVLFIDISMLELDGLDVARQIRSIFPDVFIIFIASFPDFALEAFGIYAFDYIVKPVNKERLTETIRRMNSIIAVESNLKNNLIPLYPKYGNKKVSAKYKGYLHYISIPDIIMITRIQRKSVIFTQKERIETYDSLELIGEKLSSDFIKSHKSYIINLNMVKEIIPIGSKTFIIKFVNMNETALATLDKIKIIKNILGI